MARLRHFAVCVGDLEKSREFLRAGIRTETRVGEEVIDIGSAIYAGDGVINLALLNFSGTKGNDIKSPIGHVGANHFGFPG